MSSESTALADLIPLLMDRLRHELAQYGEMLALLDQQQEHVMNRAADQVLHSVGAVNEQMGLIQKARASRESSQAEVAKTLKKPKEPTFENLIPDMPEKFQGAVQILVRENNMLLERVHKKARQNHLLLARSLEMMHQFLTTLSPDSSPTTYNENGRLAGAAPSPKQLYEAIG